MSIIAIEIIVAILLVAIAALYLRRKSKRIKKIQADLDRARADLDTFEEDILNAAKEFKIEYDRDLYFSKKTLHLWMEEWKHLEPVVERFSKMKRDLRMQVVGNADLHDSILYVHQIFANGAELVKKRNNAFIEWECETYKDLFDTLEEHPLTQNQRRSIVTDECNTLVVAGAGTGKTTTIVGKACYLIEKGLAKPEEILLIAFNRDVGAEIKKRLSSKLPKIPTIKTYHSLGLGIIGETKGIKPKTSKLAEDKIKLIKKMGFFVQKRMRDEMFAQKVNDYFLYHLVPYKSVFEFNSSEEYRDYIKKFDIRSLEGDEVRSLEECDIANFLYSNGIEYTYEKPYECNTATSTHRQYMPDFFLPEYGIYIEHFGINRKGTTAPYVNQKKYTEQMLWKRRTHEINQTTLIETYSYERQEGQLLENLKMKLLDKGVTFNKLPKERLFEKLNALGKLDQFSSLLANFLHLFKSSGKTIDELQQNDQINDREQVFIEIFSSIYDDYSSYLNTEEEIDFNDMIIRATEIIKNNEYPSNFKYILVDEFQDISQSRYRFLSALRECNDSALFCVGDDWQSIYRFTGSDISIMVDFEENFRFCERCFLDETFRFTNKLCEFSTKFILQNPIQIEKYITSRKKAMQPVVSIVKDSSNSALRKIIRKIDRHKKDGETVFLIGRYNYLEPESLNELNNDFPYIEIKFTTAHSSKGLETDYVILLGLVGGEYGFPCEIVDDPILSLVLTKQEPFPNAEERRLFYVAITRARKQVYLLADPERPSSFIKEILRDDYECMHAHT